MIKLPLNPNRGKYNKPDDYKDLGWQVGIDNCADLKTCFDLEFLIKKGISLDIPQDKLKKLLKGIEALSKNDYTVKLGSLLEASERQYYSKENFKILKSTIIGKLGKL